MFVNLSKQNFSDVNSSRNGLYFFSVVDVHFNANPSGCRCLTFFPPANVVVILCDSTPAKASFDPSVVKIIGVPSKRGGQRTGSEMSMLFSFMNVSECSLVQIPINLWAFMMFWYFCFPTYFGMSTFCRISHNGFSTFVYPFTRSQKCLVRPRKPSRCDASSGWGQFTIAISFVKSGLTPLGPTIAPANTASVMNNFSLLGDRESFSQCTLSNTVRSFCRPF